MKHILSSALVGLGLLAAGMPLMAHHSPRAGNDSSKTVALKGTVTRVDWQNPHLEFYVDVKDQAGKTTNWRIDFASPNLLVQRGLTRQMLRRGDEVGVEIWAAKNGSPNGNGRLLILADGQSISGASPWDGPLSTAPAQH